MQLFILGINTFVTYPPLSLATPTIKVPTSLCLFFSLYCSFYSSSSLLSSAAHLLICIFSPHSPPIVIVNLRLNDHCFNPHFFLHPLLFLLKPVHSVSGCADSTLALRSQCFDCLASGSLSVLKEVQYCLLSVRLSIHQFIPD